MPFPEKTSQRMSSSTQVVEEAFCSQASWSQAPQMASSPSSSPPQSLKINKNPAVRRGFYV